MAAAIPARLTAAQGRRFAFPVGGAFLLLAALLVWRGRPAIGYGFGGLGVALLLAGLVVPTRLGPVERGWMAFAERLSRITTPIFMSLVFFLVLTPVAFVARLAGHRPLLRAADAAGFWVKREAGARRSDLERQF
jgi:hypothetical protein